MKHPRLSIIEAIRDPNILGDQLSAAQEAALCALYGLPLTDAQRALAGQCAGGAWRLHVEDNGTGCEPAAAAAAGGSLCALAAWLKGLGGGLRLESAPHQGCRIELWLPMQAI